MGTTKETPAKLSFHEKLATIQFELKAPKSQFNAFAKYKYRNAEDILEAVKPLLHSQELFMSISDSIIDVNGRVYVKSTVKVTDGIYEERVEAFAREEENKKGLDLAQLTGATSSYARKYALNGMFLIDDTKDSDATNTHGKEESKTPAPPSKSSISDLAKVKSALSGANRASVINQLESMYVITPEQIKELGLTPEESSKIELKK